MLLFQSIIGLAFLSLALAQTRSNTTSSTISYDLRDCYNETIVPGILNAKERGSVSLNFFLDLLRTLEDGNRGTRDLFYLSSDIIKIFRQDGIQYTGASVGLPFIAKHNEKNQLLQIHSLDTTGTGDISMLTTKEKCSLHYLISSTMNGTERGDESSTCGKSSRYTSRIRREISLVKSIASSPSSSCPTQYGVVDTAWGTVSFGSVLSGIAAGLRLQTTPAGNSLYANTISGDLANMALLNNLETSIGSSEGWDNSINPKILYNTPPSGQANYAPLTNAYIRGSLDGFYIGSLANQLKGRYSELKMSQLLDMYYSPTGLLNETISACNRKVLQTSFMNTATLTNETRTALEALNRRIGVATMEAQDYVTLSQTVVDKFNTYLPNLPDVACNTNDLPIQRKVVDLSIYIDTKWSYETVSSVINYLVSNVDINKYEGNYTLYNGNTGEELIDSTYKLSALYEYYNNTQHTSSSQSFDWTKSFNHLQAKINAKRSKKILGGKSLIALFIVSSSPTSSELTYINDHKNLITDVYPDIQMLVLGSGSQGDYSFLSNPSKQFVQLSDVSNNVETVKTQVKSVLSVIADTPRTLVGECGGAQSNVQTYNVERNGVSYFKLHQFYYFNGGSDKQIKIREVNSQDTVQVCIGYAPKPETDCKNLTTEYSYPIECSTYSDCSPLYIAVKGLQSNSYCKDCRFPDSIQYQITLENMDCGSSATTILFNALLLVLVMLTLQF